MNVVNDRYATLVAVCLIQDENDWGDDETFENGDGSYILSSALGSTIYFVSPKGKIRRGVVSKWEDVEVVDK